MNTTRIPALQAELQAASRRNPALRRHLAPRRLTASEAKRLLMLSTQYDMAEVLGYMWRMQRAVREVEAAMSGLRQDDRASSDDLSEQQQALLDAMRDACP